MLFIAIREQSWDNVHQFNEKRKVWNQSVKPDTLMVLAEYSLQGPESKGVVLFETDRTEDVNIYRNYFALAGARTDIRVATELGESIEMVETIQAKW